MFKVLVTETGKPGTNTMITRDQNYRVVVLRSDSSEPLALLGQFLTVKIVDAREVYLIGERDEERVRERERGKSLEDLLGWAFPYTSS